ncbi:VWA domain-containing protein [Bordetella genomosp. 5]|uniref:VWFA domain-containing protein n=1 Tax=Bordetella genomosp. 5 TaxID=1395608 RepID=A0A261TRW9_9BORD|nr:VWA domain-containing protein [Bordetella genomosp. 5]OZI52021.1 hypothetical protein CAL25_10980 [Bordetella genomosp. 5]
MDLDLSAFHFLRPAWLLLVPLAVLLAWIWRRRHGLARWRGAIAPALLPHLLVRHASSRGPRPIDLLALLLALGGIAAAGPAWQHDRPDFLDDMAPLVVAVDLAPSMQANDVVPTRLEAVRHKLRDLVAARPGARTGLVVYAGTAHVVLPPTGDASVLGVFIDALGTDLITSAGRDVSGAVALAARLLASDGAGGTLLLVTDAAPSEPLTGPPDDIQVLVLAVGQRNVGAVLDGQGRPLLDARGAAVTDAFDAGALRAMAARLHAPLGSLSADGKDIAWVQAHAQRHYAAVQDEAAPQWKDAGYWLCVPLALLALACVRRGWGVAWAAAWAVVLPLSLPAPAQAGPLADAFFTRDQQGQRALDRGQGTEAAQLFADPYRRGRAAYDVGDYPRALAAFAQLRTPEGYFYQGNTQVKLHHYDAARQAYRQALTLRPDWQEAAFNLRIVDALVAAMQQEDTGQGAETPDQTVADPSASQGQAKAVVPGQAMSDEAWLRNLTLSPAQFLRTRFAAEDARPGAAP